MGTLPRAFGPPVIIDVGNNRGALRVPLRLADRGSKKQVLSQEARMPTKHQKNVIQIQAATSARELQSLKEVHDTLSNKLHLEEVEHNQQQPPSYQNGTILYK